MQNNIQKNVIALFDNSGFNTNQVITWNTVKDVFEQHCQSVMLSSFNTDLLNELLQQCRFHKQKLTPSTISQVISQANTILKNRLSVLQGDDGLISSQKKILTQMQQQLRHPKSNKAYLQNQVISLSQEISNLEKYIQQLQQNKKSFQNQLQIINKLFNGKTIKLRRQRSSNNLQQPKKLDPRYLVIIFYLAFIGIVIELLVVRLRPGWIAIVIYLQALFIILVGYYNKNAVYYLIMTGIISILLDLFAGYIMYFMQTTSHIKEINQSIEKILVVFYLFLFAISIIFRIILIFIARHLIQPPLLRVYFKICNQELSLNTRLKIGA